MTILDILCTPGGGLALFGITLAIILFMKAVFVSKKGGTANKKRAINLYLIAFTINIASLVYLDTL